MTAGRTTDDSPPFSGFFITDIGNPTDIHPTNEQGVGRRLAQLALGRDASPLYRQFTREGSAMRIWFANAGKH